MKSRSEKINKSVTTIGLGDAARIDMGIAAPQRKKITEALNAVLADTYTLYLKTHNFHWNVTGPQFHALHQMFMDQYTEMWGAVDLIAERIRALGFFAPGSYRAYASLTSIEESEETPNATTMIEELVAGHETLVKTLRKAFAPAEKGNDQATLDLLTQRIQLHEKTAWMLRSMLEA